MAATVSMSPRGALQDPERLRAVARTELAGTASHSSFDRWTALAARLLAVPLAVAKLIDDHHEYVKSAAGAQELAGRAIAVGESLCPLVIERAEPLVIADTAEHSAARAIPGIAQHGIAAYLSVPVRDADGHVVGVLCVADTAVRCWTQEDVGALCDVARGIELELRTAAADRDVVRLQALLACEHTVHEMIVGGAPLDETLSALVAGVESQADGMRGSVLLCEADGTRLRHAASPNLPAAYSQAIDGVEIGPDVGSCGTAAYTGREVLVSDIAGDFRWTRFRDLAAAHRLAACWSVPILTAEDEVVGTFAFYDSERRSPTSGELALIRHASRLAGLAVERHRSRERLVALSETDALTGLANRTKLLRGMRELIGPGICERRPLAVLFCDVNRFKVINDSLGHAAGDRVLTTVARRLEACTGPGDIVARFGGDEFVMLAAGLDDYRARGLAGRVRRVLSRPIFDDETGIEHRITVSVGVALDDGVAGAEDLIRHADAAMFAAKRTGNGVAFHEHDCRDGATKELKLHSALRSALEQDQLHVVYQPVVDLATGEIASAEALLRWTHPVLGAVSPADFVPVAERHGLIGDIGDWVLRTAGAQALDWNELSGRPVPVGVNVSPRQLTDPFFADRVADILSAIRLSPPLMTLEITETALVDDDAVTLANLDALAALGVKIALDDFGTGYSSLSHLRRLPISTIKVDRSFVDGLGSERDDTAIVTGVIGMAKGLTLSTVAEGVETDAQVAALEGLGCEFGQGYRFDRPLAASELVARLRSNRG